jgi:hypothetical protein
MTKYAITVDGRVMEALAYDSMTEALIEVERLKERFERLVTYTLTVTPIQG